MTGTTTTGSRRTTRLVLGTAVTAVLGLAATATAAPATATPATAAAAAVTVRNAGFSPTAVTVPYGGRVTWTFAQGTHSVTDPSRLRLFASGPQAQGTRYAFTFVEAGTYPYRSTVGTPISGSVVVPMTVRPATGTRTTPFAVRWASGFSPAGYVEDVEIRPPGGGWTSFALAISKDAVMRPVDWGNRTGVYQFRARPYREASRSLSSGWSPVVSVTVR